MGDEQIEMLKIYIEGTRQSLLSVQSKNSTDDFEKTMCLGGLLVLMDLENFIKKL